MNKLEKIYLELLLEAQFDNEDFKRFDIYKGIEIYYNYEHVKQRLQERYSNKTFSIIRLLIKAFLKNLIKQNYFIIENNNTISFICHCNISNIWIAGRFKKNFGKWRVEINTVLPKNPIFSKTFNYYEVNK